MEEFIRNKNNTILSFITNEATEYDNFIEFVQIKFKKKPISVVVNSREVASQIINVLGKNGIPFDINKEDVTNLSAVHIYSLKSLVPSQKNIVIAVKLSTYSEIEKAITYTLEDRLVITNRFIDFHYDTFYFSTREDIEEGYYLFQNNYSKYCADYFQMLFSSDKAVNLRLFDNERYYLDSYFMSYLLEIKVISFSFLFKHARVHKNAYLINSFVGKHLDIFLNEIHEKQDFSLIFRLGKEFGFDRVITIAYQSNLSVFDGLTKFEKEDLFLKYMHQEDIIMAGVKLKIWNYTKLFRLVTASKVHNYDEFLKKNLEALIQDIEFNCALDMLQSALEQFDNRKILKICFNHKTLMMKDFEDSVKEGIFKRVADDFESLDLGYAVKAWNFLSIYEYGLKNSDYKKKAVKYLEKHFRGFTNEVREKHRGELINNIIDDFDELLILNFGLDFVKNLSDTKKEKLFFDTVLYPKKFTAYFEAGTWEIDKMYSWYVTLEKKPKAMHEAIASHLYELTYELGVKKNSKYSVLLLKHFDNHDVLINARDTNSACLRDLTDEQKEALFLEICNDTDAIDAMLRLGLYDVVKAYHFGQQNIWQRDKINEAISRNIIILIEALKSCNVYSLTNGIMQDFDLKTLFYESKIEGLNLFQGANERYKEELIKIIIDDMESVEWAVKNKAFTYDYVYEKCRRNGIDMTNFFRLHYPDFIFVVPNDEFLAKEVCKAGLIDEVVLFIRKRFKSGRAKELKNNIDKVKDTVTAKPIEIKAAPVVEKRNLDPYNVSLEEMLELIK